LPQLSDWNQIGTEVLIHLKGNSLETFVELPETARNNGLQYLGMIAGGIEGALNAINLKVSCVYENDMLLGEGEESVLKLTLIEIGVDEAGESYRDDV